MTGFASKRAMARSLQDDIIDGLANRMRQNIDDEVMMTAMGWTPYTISHGTIYGDKYLTVHPSNGSRWNEMMQWMVDAFGPSAVDGVWTPKMRWYANNSKFWFRDPKDLTMFILRWS
jgi:hypothetical protein